MARLREYTITFSTDDYICRDGVDLEVDDLLVEIEGLCRTNPQKNLPDMVIWEDDRICAIVHHTAGAEPPLSVIRFDRPATQSASA